MESEHDTPPDHAVREEAAASDGGPQAAPAAGAGTAVRPAPAGLPVAGDGAGADAEGRAGAPPSPARRVLKLVVTLRPDGGASPPGYRALLALGADGCDPVLRAVEAADLRAAVDQVPALVAEAEARWRATPRNPAAGRAPGARPDSPRRPAAPTPATASPAPTSPQSSAAPTGAPGPGGQLSLFG